MLNWFQICLIPKVSALHLKFYNPRERARKTEQSRVAEVQVCRGNVRSVTTGVMLSDLVGFKNSSLNGNNCTPPNPRDHLGHLEEKLRWANKKSCATAWISMEGWDPCNSNNYWGAKGLLGTSVPGWGGDAFDIEANKLLASLTNAASTGLPRRS